MLRIKIEDSENPQQSATLIPTNGYLLLYLEGNKIQMKGQMEFNAIAPLLAKAFMEKMQK